MGSSARMTADNRLCLHCGACVGACPTNSIFLHETACIEFLESCVKCELCATVCPVGSIRRLSAPASEFSLSLAQEAGA